MKIISRIWCFLRGHDFVEEGSFDNGTSKYGAYRCVRCGKIHDWQYDYRVN